ncbi:HD domain-containing phosphohydrolase [Halomonas saccharevitans]|uniref:HD domain-containing phosphohydrolase n=1 Tax=Halomonas saccharevitans TaxID=416872 RepID=A0ABU3NE60_9GAMM|nr:HD domain-containing phosphohydrolase [Halomonas saccharevitans]MDT8879317.1 HD domain-containing phosphohydrolase [Halomonas saccharevitans]
MSRRPLSLQALTVLAIVALMLMMASVLLWHGARGADRILVSAMQDTSHQLAATTEERSQRLIGPARVVLLPLSHANLGIQQRLADRLTVLPMLAAALEASRVASAVYIGYDNGDFLSLRPVARLAPNLLPAMNGVEDAHYLVQAIFHDPGSDVRVGEWRLYDAELALLDRRVMPDYDYDPRTRPWYREAMASDGEHVTDPYVFFTTREVGVTLTHRSQNERAVLGIDASLADLGNEMAGFKLTPGTRLAVVSNQGRTLAHPDIDSLLINTASGPRLGTLEELGDPILARLEAFEGSDESTRFQGPHEAWFGMRLPFKSMDDVQAHLLMAVPENELLAGTRRLLWQRAVVAVGLVLALLPLGIWVGHRLGRPLRSLADQVRALAEFDFAGYRGVDSPIREVQQLSQAVEGMVGNITDFQRMTRTLSSDPHLETMLAGILDDLLRVTTSQHGAIYLVDETDADAFARAAEAGSGGGVAPPLPERLKLEAQGLAALRDEFEDRGYLAQPLCNRSGQRQGLLLLALRGAAEASDDQPWRRFVEEISGVAAVAIEMRRLLEGEKRLLDAIVELIAGATDAKSPHTGGHCSRVPQLAEMLLQGVERDRTGPFAAEAVDEDRRAAFHLAAWLHDCGKLTTPDEVMEKATKLETRYNRLHEVRMRFEVLWRDADVAYWQGCAEGGDPNRLDEAREQRLAELQAAFRLVANINLGGEHLDEGQAQRLEEIATWRWWRHFDDRLGVSQEEARRLAREPELELPVAEPLLADRPRHLIDWAVKTPPVAPEDPDNRWRFDMRPPAVAGHQGELYNLRVARGTLNDVERFRIQEHIVQTIIMLESLPWPAHLRRVPAIAGNHHERMDGQGYPRRLVLAGASLEERIMAVADVFEALTAADRPYKPGMSLSQALSILASMAREGHLDPEVFLLLLDSGVWRDYAERFLKPEQIVPVDIAALKAEAGLVAPAT